MSNQPLHTITLAGGCFWCLEAVFKRLRGVEKVSSGYTNGNDAIHPTYEKVCSGRSGYAEAVQISFDPAIIRLETLLDVFWLSHDPTTLNRQGNDIGSQYRSGIYYSDPGDLPLIQASVHALEETKTYPDPLVTEIEPLRAFYAAEDYHADYYDRNRQQGYCRIIIDPKIEKLAKNFGAKLK